MKRWAVSAIVCAASMGSAQLSEVERKGVENTLFLGNLKLSDLEFARRPHDDKFRLPLVNLSIDKPLDATDRLMELHGGAVPRSVSANIARAREELYAGQPTPTLPAAPQGSMEAAGSSALPPELAPLITRLANYVAKANAAVRSAQSKLSPADLRLLMESLPQWATEEPSIKFEFVQQPMASQTQILDMLDRVDVHAIIYAAEELAAKINVDLAELKRLGAASKWTGTAKFKVGEMICVVAGIDDDTHRDRDARLVIDLGGNDRYYGRAGAGPGYAAVSIDLGGDDHYKLPDLGAGCGVLGIGLAYDFGGHDNFRGKSLAYGAGLAGVGVFFKDGGDDSYQTSALTQGFATFGVGLLVDTRGGDLYDCKFYGQGASRTMGYGQLIDRDGDDTYRAGGLIFNSPLFTNVHYSNAQGFSSGYRDDRGGVSGGIGLLTDAEGDDAYIGETYCQAASYWYALGSLWDADGLDTYRAYHYAQASAMHMCGAYLLDLAGDDSYINNFGAAHAIGHDYGVAVLFDRAGNDVYAGRDSRPGIGNANGLGLFLDAAGDDRYSGPTGTGNPARNTGSLGVFADLGGQDLYRTGLADGEGALREQWGVAYDIESKLETGTAPDVPAPPAPGSIARPSDADLERIYVQATKWNVGSAQTEVREATYQLIGIGLPALQWMVDKKLATASRLEQQAFVNVAKAIGHEGLKLVAAPIAGENEDAALVAMMICIDAAAAEAAQHLSIAIKKPKLQRTAARLAQTAGNGLIIEDLMALTASEDKLTALNATLALAAIGDARGQAVGIQLMRSPELPVRRAALTLLARFPDALGVGTSLMKDSDEQVARTALELLGLLGTSEAMEAAAPGLSDARPGIRITTLLVLNGRAPQSAKQLVLDLRRDPDERVRAIALRIDPGR